MDSSAARFVELDARMTEINKDLSAVRKSQRELAEGILQYMEDRGIAEFDLPDGTKLVRKEQKRTGPLNADLIHGVLEGELQDPARASRSVEKIMEQRQVVAKERLVRVKRPRAEQST